MNKRVTVVVLALILAGLLVVPARGQGTFPEPTVPEEWDALDADGLRELANQLKRQGPATHEQRVLLGQYLAWKCMNDAADARAAGLEFWQSCTEALAQDLADATRFHWIAALRQAFAGTEGALAGLDTKGIRPLCEALNALRDADMPILLADWIRQSGNLGTADAGDLCWAAVQIAGSGDQTREARRQLIDHVGNQYLEDPSQAKRARPGMWNSLCRFLARDMDAGTRAAWSSGMRAGFTSNAAELAALDGSDLLFLASALQQLGDQGADVVVANWVDSGGDLSTCDPAQVCLAAARLKASVASGRAARARLIQHLTAARMGSDQAIRDFDHHRWNGLVQLLQEDLSEEDRIRWIEKFRAAYVETGDGLSALSASAIGVLDQLFLRLGWHEYPATVVRWASDQSNWQAWEPRNLLWLARKADAVGEGGNALRRQLADHLMATYLKDATTAGDVGSGTWQSLARYVGSRLPDEILREWARKLRECYTNDPPALSVLPAADVKRLAGALRQLDASQAGELVAAWHVSRSEESPVPATESALAGMPSSTAPAGQPDPLLTQLDAQWEQEFSEGALTWRDAANVVSNWLEAGDMAKARQWVTRAYSLALGSDEARQAADGDTLKSLGVLLCHVGLTGEETEFTAFAEVVSRLAREGTLPHDLLWHINCQWGKVTHMPQTRQVLRNNLLDDAGVPRLGVAKVLAWAYLAAEDLQTWTGFLEERIRDPEISEDARAVWLLARAEAATVTLPNEPTFKRARPWLDKAIAAAQSEPVRIACLREFATYFIELGQPQLGSDMLASIQEQFGPASAAALQENRERLSKAQVFLDGQRDRERIHMVIGQKRGRLAYLRGRLSAAAARGDEDAAANLRTAIRQLEAELAVSE